MTRRWGTISGVWYACAVVPRKITLAGALALVAIACTSGRGSQAGVPASVQRSATSAKSTTTTTAPAATTTTSPPTTVPPAPPSPPRIQAAGWASAPGDGAWSSAGWAVGGGPAVYTTILHHAGGSAPIAVAWMDTARLRFALYAGSSQPSGTWPQQSAVPLALRGSLVAAFNSGFQLASSRGGWYLDGRSAVALQAGAASLVIYQNGSATVGAWGRDVALTADVTAVRQNLTLMVDHGAPVPGLTTDVFGAWGITLGRVVFTWRSALGVDAGGHLIYVAGPFLDPATLAGALVAAGAVRAMELDINPEWVSFDSFAAGGASATKLLPTMWFSALHFLAPFWRDFVAVFART